MAWVRWALGAWLVLAVGCGSGGGQRPRKRPPRPKPLIVAVQTEPGPAVPRAGERSVLRQPNAMARTLAVAEDGSIYLVGDTAVPGPPERAYERRSKGRDRVRYISSQVRKGLVARYAAGGELLWRRVLDLDAMGEEVLWDVAARPDGTACVLGHDFATDNNGSVRCFSRDGEPMLAREFDIPRSTRLLAMPDGSLVVGGSQVLAWKDGWAHAAAWVGRIHGERVSWHATQVGEFSSRSEVNCIARSPAGEMIAGGRIGRRDGGPASRPWVAKWDASGTLLWSETMKFYAWRDQEVRAVAVAANGDIFAAGFTGASWLRRYDAGGRLLAEHRFPATEHLASLVATEGGYVVHGATSTNPWDPARGAFTSSWIRAYSNAGKLLWAATRRDECTLVRGLERGARGEWFTVRACLLPECKPNTFGLEGHPSNAASCWESMVVAYQPP